MTIELSRLAGLTDWMTQRAVVAAQKSGATASASRATSSASEDSAAMKDAAAVIQDYLSGPVQPPTFNVDYLSGLNVMTVRSANNGEVIFQMPGPAALRLAQLIKEGSPLSSNTIVSEVV